MKRAAPVGAISAVVVCVATLASPRAGRADDAPARGAPRASVESALVDELLGDLAKVTGLQATFHEEKQIALLKAPLKGDGRIHFMHGRGLARHTLTPRRQSLLVTDRAIVFWDGKKTETIGLETSSVLRAFAEAFTLSLAGDRRGLEKNFAIAAAGDAKKAWSLRLTPREDNLKKILASIEVRGDGRSLSSLVVKEASGDVSTTTFSDVDVDHRYDDKEADAAFRTP